nr:hypothetical protein [Tanacetum cinerariifolium]GEY13645.1 hypothetical protein [Tanacetum cinerariifolium]
MKRTAKKEKSSKPTGDVTLRWTSDEETLLAECFVAVSEDRNVGRSQPRDTLWFRVFNEFNRKSFQKRTKDMLSSKWNSLAEADDESGFGYTNHAGLPLALANIIGTTHTLEMKSHTYYEHGTFESFSCWRIAPKEVVDVDSESSNMNTSAEVNITKVKRLATKPSVATPSKPTEERGKDSDDKVTGDMDDGGVDDKESSLTDKRKKKRYIMDDCDSAWPDINLLPVLQRNVFRIDFLMGGVLADVLTYHCIVTHNHGISFSNLTVIYRLADPL